MKRNVTKRNETNAEPIRCMCVFTTSDINQCLNCVYLLALLLNFPSDARFHACLFLRFAVLAFACLLACTLFPSIGLYSFDFLSYFIFRFLLYFTLFLRIRIHARSFACMPCFHSLFRPQSSFVNTTHANAQHSCEGNVVAMISIQFEWILVVPHSDHFALFLLFTFAQLIHIKIKAKGDRSCVFANFDDAIKWERARDQQQQQR